MSEKQTNPEPAGAEEAAALASARPLPIPLPGTEVIIRSAEEVVIRTGGSPQPLAGASLIPCPECPQDTGNLANLPLPEESEQQIQEIMERTSMDRAQVITEALVRVLKRELKDYAAEPSLLEQARQADGMFPVDVLTLLAPGETVHSAALDALARQGTVALTHHLVEGRPLPGERRVQTIARARNLAKAWGQAHYVMFLDRDVVLPPRGIERLIYGLLGNPHHAALGINYQTPTGPCAWHVAMGAVLFYRPILEQIRFRSAPGRCECACCCEDIRAMGYAIDYLPGMRAKHLRER